jgi:hypothetical protein
MFMNCLFARRKRIVRESAQARQWEIERNHTVDRGAYVRQTQEFAAQPI